MIHANVRLQYLLFISFHMLWMHFADAEVFFAVVDEIFLRPCLHMAVLRQFSCRFAVSTHLVAIYIAASSPSSFDSIFASGKFFLNLISGIASCFRVSVLAGKITILDAMIHHGGLV